MEVFGKNLRAARKKLKMNQQALGEAIGVGQTTIANYEKGVRFPTGEILKKIAEILNVSVDFLMGHEVIKPQALTGDKDMDVCLELFTKALLGGREQEAIALIWALAPDKNNLLLIYEKVLMRAMITIGDLWEQGEIGVAVEHFSAHVVHKIIAMLSTIPSEEEKGSKSAICMSFSSEPHTIGIKMVSEYLNLSGIRSFYIGTNVPADSLMEMLMEKRPDMLAISATMPYHIESLKSLIERIRKTDDLKELSILVGGQAFSRTGVAADAVKADGCALDFEAIGSWLQERGLISIDENPKQH